MTMITLHVATSPQIRAEAADDVVGLVAGSLFDRDVEGVDQLPHAFDLRPQIVGHGAAVRLVLGELFVPKRRPAFQGDDGVLGLLPAQHVQQHRGEPEHGVDDLALGGRDLVLDGVVGAEDQPVAVDQQQGRAIILSLLLMHLLWFGHAGNPPRIR